MQVLQLDLCAFTEFSQKMSPMQLAHALHHIFSSFDKVVQGVNFFKMDTVGDVQGGEAGGAGGERKRESAHAREREGKGARETHACTTLHQPTQTHTHIQVGDAYIVAAWLPSRQDVDDATRKVSSHATGKQTHKSRHNLASRVGGEDASEGGADEAAGGTEQEATVRKLCLKMLWLAGSMLETIDGKCMCVCTCVCMCVCVCMYVIACVYIYRHTGAYMYRLLH